ncbi:MAG: CBS domain-containing protein, partial [Saprospiraceae bacterium]|nr:CBS domain-containing protein [Saprospiraceae bacterium]
LYFHQKPIYLQSKLLEDINFEHQEAISLHQMEMQDLLETDLRQINPEMTLGDLVKIIASSRRNLFPVVQTGQLMGVLLLDDIRPIMFDTSRYQELKAKDLMILPPATIEWNEPMSSVLSKFEKTGAWNLPVLDGGKYKGFISKSNILSEYREALRKSRDID